MISIEKLSPCDLFVGLNETELEQVAAIAYEETYQSGDQIFAAQEAAERLYILCQGRVQLHIRLRSALEPGGDVTIEAVEPGCVFGWSSLVKQRRFTGTARALEPLTVIVLEARELTDLFDQNAHIGFVVMKQLAEVIASRLDHARRICQQATADD